MKRFSLKPATFFILFSACALTASAESKAPAPSASTFISTAICVLTSGTHCVPPPPPPPPPCTGNRNAPNGKANPNTYRCNAQ